MIAVMEEQPPKPKYLDTTGRLVCPCGSYDFEVRDSEPWEHGRKRRYRCCLKCGVPVRTKEVIDDE